LGVLALQRHEKTTLAADVENHCPRHYLLERLDQPALFWEQTISGANIEPLVGSALLMQDHVAII
jgi:hypothetical protein